MHFIVFNHIVIDIFHLLVVTCVPHLVIVLLTLISRDKAQKNGENVYNLFSSQLGPGMVMVVVVRCRGGGGGRLLSGLESLTGAVAGSGV